MKKKKVKINYKNIVKVIIIILLIIGIIIGIKEIQYRQTDEFKLKEIGYNNEQIEKISKLKNEYKEKLLKIDYNEFLLELYEEKYFIFDNVDKYLDYHLKNEVDTPYDVVAKVNVGMDNEPYTNTKKTDMDKGNLILVNKFNYLDKKYVPENLYNIKDWYAYGENQIVEEVYDAFIEMYNSAKERNLYLIITSGYRDYDEQSETYEEYKDRNGTEAADHYAARPGFSEHQTGLCLDIMTYDTNTEDFENTNEFKWLQENAYKYGFILRYPKGKESITGYDYESWHYRYVGKEVAQKIHDLNITFDEYYAYYIK